MSDFLPEPHLLLLYCLSVAILNLTPGPDMTFFLSRSIAAGKAAGMAAMLGATTGILIHTLLVVFGLSALIAASPSLYNLLRIAGALYLLYLAWQSLSHGSAFKVKAGKEPRARPLAVEWLQGIAINLLNPKIVVFFLTFLPQFVPAGDPHAGARLLALGLLFSVIGVTTMTPVVLAASAFSNWMQQRPLVTRAMDWLFAGVLGAFAARLLLTARNA
jgi:threonine/homoserine/homoserine lactone efflux protein